MKTDHIYNHINQDSELFRVLKYLPKPQPEGPWLAGGSLWKAIENQPIEHDLDFFFKDVKQCEEWLATIRSIPYVHHIVGEKSNRYNITYKFHVNERGYNKTISVQCVSFKCWNSITDLLEGFDFTACQFGFDGRMLFTGDTAFEDVRARAIRFNKIHDSNATQIHLEKYLAKGFTISPEQARIYETMRLELSQRRAERRNSGPSFDNLILSSRPTRLGEVSNDDEDGYPMAVEEAPATPSISSIPPVTISPSFYTSINTGGSMLSDYYTAPLASNTTSDTISLI